MLKEREYMYNVMFEDIKKYSDMKKLSFFIGAGVSKVSGFPSWFNLVKSMGDEIKYVYNTYTNEKGDEIINLQSDEFLKIPEMYHAKFDETKYLEKVKENFKKIVHPNKVHDLIMAFHPNHVLTTNYDTLIEETAVKFGKNYSVIASDQDVSKAETIKYILKVHGDFSTNFVLKESDYLNYDNKYQLISNLMKSIFATNLIVFVGYGLNDYNIKLILNWVYNLQKENFIKPIFINTDNPISDVEREYYYSRGIRIIDSNDFADVDDEHLTKYIVTLNKMLDFTLNPQLDDKQKVLELLYDSASGVKNLNYIKRSDFDKMFLYDFTVNDEWNIVYQKHSSKLNDFWGDYLTNKLEYDELDNDKCQEIDMFLKNCNIRGMEDDSKLYFPEVDIENLSFNGNYNEMINFCNSNYVEIREQYKKAYYLSRLGKLEESYNMFTELLKVCKVNKSWDIYYFSQINRKHLFSLIKFARSYYQHPVSILATGQPIYVVSEEFYNKMSLEMLYHDSKSQFEELPYNFKQKYAFLREYSQNNCFSNEMNNLLKDKYEVEKQLMNKTTSTGLSKFDKIKLDMLEAHKFIQDNMILFESYAETKNYTRNAMLIWLQAYQKEITKKRTDIFGNFCNTRLTFTVQDIILLSKNCELNDLKYFEKTVSFKLIPFTEEDILSKYINRMLDFYQAKFSKDFLTKEYLFWREISTQIKSLLYLSTYFLKEKSCVEKIINFVSTNTDGFFVIQERLNIISRFVNEETTTNIVIVLEKWIIEKIDIHLSTPNEQYLIDIREISNMLRLIGDSYKCECLKLSQKALNLKDKSIFKAIVKLSNLLSDEAKNVVLQEYNISDVWSLIEKSKVDANIELTQHIQMITDYFETTIEQNNKNKIAGITQMTYQTQEYFVRQVICFLVENKIQIDEIEKYKNNWAEFDFMFVSEFFDIQDFDSDWLLYYSEDVLEYIKNDSVRNSIVKNSLKKLDKAICKDNIERWLYLFETFI